MKVVMLDVPESVLAERRRKGHDRFDEVWEGVLHMVPAPSDGHQRFGGDLYLTLGPIAKAKGLVATYETAIHRPGAVDRDYRQPDLIFSLPSQRTKRGVVGPCELAVEILSPGDETYDKIPFYASVGVRELLVVHPETRVFELFSLKRGRLVVSRPTGGLVPCRALGVTFRKVKGPKLRVTWDEGETDI
jgi:Uma2 family endonuclease